MNEQDSAEARAFRQAVYIVLVTITLAGIVGRISIVKSGDRRTPFLSANDRSRWCTISALVDYGTYQIDQVISRRGWDTIDKVRHNRWDGEPHFYSSKPPLLPTLLAGEYWLIKQLTGVSIQHHPFYVGRIMLVLSNVIPLALFFVLLIKLVEELGTTDFGRLFVVAAACFGTHLTSYAVTISNHLPAAICVLAALHSVHRIVTHSSRSGWRFAVAGFFASFAAANELPALSFLVCITLLCFWASPGKTLTTFLPAATLVAAGSFGTNYIAHKTLKPAYAHRTPGENWYDYESSYWMGPRKGVDQGEPSRLVYSFNVLIGHHGIFSLTPIWLFSLVGTLKWLRDRAPPKRVLAVLNGLLTTVCLAFYILRPEIDRNYGGVNCGFRWMIWFVPIWLLTMVPVADDLGKSKIRRALAMLALAVSVFSASYGSFNPWISPWIYEYWRSLGWISS
jgi:hypothetical protein